MTAATESLDRIYNLPQSNHRTGGERGRSVGGRGRAGRKGGVGLCLPEYVYSFVNSAERRSAYRRTDVSRLTINHVVVVFIIGAS